MSGGPLESSVTLDQVFAVVGTKRVPLAPELAGYLVLEVAEHADPNGGDVDPKSVYVSEEGIVALVKPKRESAVGDAETSIRAALARLLEASGSQTPALAAASKRKNGGGLPALAEELEAALIPVNRAAGRRALARLAREVKRVALGVGRNALPSTPSAEPGPPPSRRPSSPALAAPSPPTPPPPPVEEEAAPPFPLAPSAPPPPPSPPAPRPPSAASFSPQEEPTTARGQIPDEVLKKATPEPGRTSVSELPTMEFATPGRTSSPSQADVDALIADFSVSATSDQQHARSLKKMAGLEPTPPPPEIARRMETRAVPVSPGVAEAAAAGDADVESLLALGDEPQSKRSGSAPAATAGAVRAAPATPAPVLEVPNSEERQLPTQPSKLKQNRASLPSVPRLKASRGPGWVVVILAVAAIAAGAYAITLLPHVGASARQDPQSPTGSAASPGPASSTCIQTLVVSDVPPHAEVLVRKGQAPVDVERMPVGARLEFVATAEGYAPKRVVVPAGAAWDPGPDAKPRYEAAVQLDKSKAPHGTNDAWPAGEPGSAVGGQGPPGTVHVVATPRGAEVWMLAGLGPDARIEQQQGCGEDVDVLLAGPTTYRKRIHVAASDFAPEESAPTGGASAPSSSPPTGKAPRRVAHVSAK
jgi:hypothetical protein